MTMTTDRPHTMGHTFDDNGCCTHCGFNSDEWRWWKYNTNEGRASKQKMPACTQQPDQANDR